MSVYIDESGGKRFVRYTSDDSKESVEEFVARMNLSVDWSAEPLASTRYINGQALKSYRLPIMDGVLFGSLPPVFPATSLLSFFKRQMEGDGYLQAVQAELDAGATLHHVDFVLKGSHGPATYVFQLARLGSLSAHEVSAGGAAVEQFLANRRQRMATEAQEARRLEFLLKRVCAPFTPEWEREIRRAQHVLAAEVGGPTSSRAGQSIEVELAADASMSGIVTATLHDALARFIAELALNRGYPYEQVANITDEALGFLTRTG